MPARRWLMVAAGAVVLVALFVVLRPDAPQHPGATSPSVGVIEVPPGAATPTPGQPTPTPTGSLDAVEIEVEEGRVEGPQRITVALGERVAIEVESDVADEVHVHGYDLTADVRPGSEVVVTFRATIPGVFEIELERSGILLTQLEVTP